MTGILNILAGSISSAIKDGYFNLVSLLLPGNGTNGAQNNTFLDSSSNNFSITRNGNTTQGTFSPFSQTGWGMYLNGTSYVQPSGSTTTLLGGVLSTSSVFTIEGWFNVPGSIVIAGDLAATSNNNTFAVNINSSGYPTLGWWNGSAYTTRTGTVVAPFNTWNHIAWVVTGGNVYFYVNGVSAGSAAIGNSSGSPGTIVLGGYNNSFSAGYYSNFRICKSAVYSGAFTPSTTPLTTSSQGATNCTLLTFQSNRFLDNSSTANTFTLGGSPSVQAFSPFYPVVAYTPSTIGGSGYFDGAGDYLVMASASSAVLPSTSTTPFTVECWVYNTGTSSTVLYSALAAENYGFVIGFGSSVGTYDSTQTPWFANYTGSWNGIRSSTAIPRNAWTHIACVFTGSTCYLYQDGVMRASGGPTTWGVTGSTKVRIGCRADATTDVFTGYIAGSRVTIGGNLYPSGTTFTPPTAPPTTTVSAGTCQLLLNFTNGGIIDATGKNVLETVGNAQISTTQSKFGGSSIYLDGTGDWLLFPSSQTVAFGTGDFTIEFWYYTGTTSGFRGLFSTSSSDGETGTFRAYLNNANTGMTMKVGATDTNFTQTLTANAWVHLAFVRSSGTLAMYYNGTKNGTTASITTDILAKPLIIGANFINGTEPFTGYFDDIRISKYARYTGNFTPQTSQWQDQ